MCLWMQHMRGIGVTGTEVWVVEAMASARTTLAFQLASVSSENDVLKEKLKRVEAEVAQLEGKLAAALQVGVVVSGEGEAVVRTPQTSGMVSVTVEAAVESASKRAGAAVTGERRELSEEGRYIRRVAALGSRASRDRGGCERRRWGGAVSDEPRGVDSIEGEAEFALRQAQSRALMVLGGGHTEGDLAAIREEVVGMDVSVAVEGAAGVGGFRTGRSAGCGRRRLAASCSL